MHRPGTHLMVCIAGGAWVEVEAAALAKLCAGQLVFGVVAAEQSSAELNQYAGYVDLWLA